MLLEAPSIRVATELPLEEKIGEGQYREVFRSDPFVIKRLKKFVVKRRGRSTVPTLLQPYVRKKYGIDDFNRHELIHFRQLAEMIPPALRDSFNPIHWAGHHCGGSFSLSDLVLNADGTLAHPLAKSGIILDPEFWNTLAAIEDFLLSRRMFFTGINSGNVLVRQTENSWQPVIVDYKWLGWEAYPWQFWLRSWSFMEKKIRLKFKEMRMLSMPH
jgi:hypothetical protein